MPEGKQSVFKRLSRNNKITLICAACVIIVGVCCGAWAVLGEQKEDTISVDGEETTCVTFQHTVGELLDSEGITLSEEDTINVKLDQQLEDDQHIAIQRAFGVSIEADGTTIQMNIADGTVADALEEAGLILGEQDTVTPSLDTAVTSGMVIDVDRITIEEVIKETELAYTIERKRDSSMSIYDEEVIQEGKVGLQKDTYRVTYCDGEIINEELIGTETQDPVNEIVLTGSYDVASRSGVVDEGDTAFGGYGDNESGYAPNGMPCSDVLTVKATAYTHDGTMTKMGTPCRVGAIAVDPSVIPLGSKLYVEGYGVCTAEDTGGLIKGNRIDVFLNTEEECVAWGVKSVKVYILD